jgi:NAD(P)-dependent dehydrogenase (short-subunit alcohol dehydrogenase family)
MKTTLITGTSKGIGNILCKHYIKQNHKVISISRNEIDFTHDNLIHLRRDITHNMLKTVISEFFKHKNIKINNCILNAGVNNNAMFHKMTYEEWLNTMNVNLISIYNILNPILNNMRDNNTNGNIIFMSSVLAKTGAIGGSNYACSKSALYGLTKSLALENAKKGILINSVSPGYINEGMGNLINNNYKNQIIEKIPMNRFGESSDIIDIIDFLTEKNKYITGTNIDVNGGMI